MENSELEQKVIETNLLVKKLIRQQKWAFWTRVLNLLIVLGLLGGFYVAIKNYIPEQLRESLDFFQEQFQSFAGSQKASN